MNIRRKNSSAGGCICEYNVRVTILLDTAAKGDKKCEWLGKRYQMLMTAILQKALDAVVDLHDKFMRLLRTKTGTYKGGILAFFKFKRKYMPKLRSLKEGERFIRFCSSRETHAKRRERNENCRALGEARLGRQRDREKVPKKCVSRPSASRSSASAAAYEAVQGPSFPPRCQFEIYSRNNRQKECTNPATLAASADKKCQRSHQRLHSTDTSTDSSHLAQKSGESKFLKLNEVNFSTSNENLQGRKNMDNASFASLTELPTFSKLNHRTDGVGSEIHIIHSSDNSNTSGCYILDNDVRALPIHTVQHHNGVSSENFEKNVETSSAELKPKSTSPSACEIDIEDTDILTYLSKCMQLPHFEHPSGEDSVQAELPDRADIGRILDQIDVGPWKDLLRGYITDFYALEKDIQLCLIARLHRIGLEDAAGTLWQQIAN